MRRKQGSQRPVNGVVATTGHRSNDGPLSGSGQPSVGVGESPYSSAASEAEDHVKFRQMLYKYQNDGVNIDTILVSKSSNQNNNAQQNRVEFPAHKIILRTCKYFEKLFILAEKMSIELGDSSLEKNQNDDNIERHYIDTEPLILENILKYIYTGEIDVDLNNFLKIFQASKMLELKNLTKKLSNVKPKGLLTIDNWLELFRYAIREKNEHFFQEVYTYISNLNINEFFRSPEFMSIEFEELEILASPPSRFFTNRETYQETILNWWNNKKSTIPIKTIVQLMNSPFEIENQNNHLDSSSHQGNNFFQQQEQEQLKSQNLANKNGSDIVNGQKACFDTGTSTSSSSIILDSPSSSSVENCRNETDTITTRKRKRDQSSTPEKNKQMVSISQAQDSSKINHEDKNESVSEENSSNILFDEDSLFKICNICERFFEGSLNDRKMHLYVHLKRNHYESYSKEWKKYLEMEQIITNKNSLPPRRLARTTAIGIDENNSIILKRPKKNSLKNVVEDEINPSGITNINISLFNETPNSDLVGTSSAIMDNDNSQQTQVAKRPRGRPFNKDKDGLKIKPKLKKPHGGYIGRSSRGRGRGRGRGVAKPHLQKMKQNRESDDNNTSSISTTETMHNESSITNYNESYYINNCEKNFLKKCYVKLVRLDLDTILRCTSASNSATNSPSKLKNNQDCLSDVTDFDLDLLENEWPTSKNVNEDNIWLQTFTENSAVVEKFEWVDCELIFLAKSLESNTLMRYSFKERTVIGNEITLPFPNLENFGLVANSERLYLIGGNSFTENLIPFSEINSFPFDKINNSTQNNSCFWQKENELESERALFSTILIGKYIYILGGCNKDRPTNYIERYNTGDCTEWPDSQLKDCNLHFCRERFSIAHYQNKIFMSGGIGKHWERTRNQLVLKTTEVFDIDKRETYSLKDMIYKRIDHKLIFFQDKLYSIGGLINSKKTNTIEIFDLELKEWKLGHQMHYKRSNLAAFVLDDNLYVLGGNDGDPTMEKLDFDSGWVIVECGSFPKNRELDFSQSVLVSNKCIENLPHYEHNPNDNSPISWMVAQDTQLLTICNENSNESEGSLIIP